MEAIKAFAVIYILCKSKGVKYSARQAKESGMK